MKNKLRKDIGEKNFDADSFMPTPTPIDELSEWINEVKAKGATHIDWVAHGNVDVSYSVDARAYFEYEETDEQCFAREAKEKEQREKIAAMQLEYAKMQYELLKQQFEEKYEK